MAQRTLLHIPDAPAQAGMYQRFFDEEGLTQKTVLDAIDLTFQRADVFLRDALDVFALKGQFESACKAGCGFCCHTLVSALPPEALYVATYLETGMSENERQELKAEVRKRHEDFRGKDGWARYASRAACPFLDSESWNCRLHVARPTVCRAMHSGSLEACKTAYTNQDPTVPAPTMKAFFDYRDATFSGLSSALSLRGLKMRPVELNAALVTIWDNDDIMDRWLAGEDVFSDARVPA